MGFTSLWLALLMVIYYFGLSLQQENIFLWFVNYINYPSVDYKLTKVDDSGSLEFLQGISLATECAIKCYSHPSCRSFNYNAMMTTCELLGGTDKESDQYQTNFSEGSRYYRRETFAIDRVALGPCAASPCQQAEQCLDVLTEEDGYTFYCECLPGYGGATCQQYVGESDWAQWGQWDTCSTSCGDGWQVRSRSCRNTVSGLDRPDVECVGAGLETTICSLGECPAWETWSTWGACSTFTTCGQGSRAHDRKCLHGGIPGGDRGCRGATSETEPCNYPACTTPVRLSPGSEVGEGSLLVHRNGTWGAICSNGWDVQDAFVACRQMGFTSGAAGVNNVPSNGHKYYLTLLDCEGTEASLVTCPHNGWQNLDACATGEDAGVRCIVDGAWSNWGSWGACSVTCENGTQQRYRDCSAPASKNGGKVCTGEVSQEQECVEIPCPVDGEWLSWSSWDTCSVTCGGGTQTRGRECQEPEHSGSWCQGDYNETQDCNTQPCPVDGYWEPWTAWETCTATCGGGKQNRNRMCVEPMHAGDPCVGPVLETQDCNTHNCPIDGVWGEWATWGSCNQTCGGGTAARNRVCQTPKYGGKPCQGTDLNYKVCNAHECPINGLWMAWGQWSECSKSCVNGTQTRWRQCDGPRFDGKNCTGDWSENKECFLRMCPVDGVWEAWERWGPCSVTCAEGIQSRSRGCDGPYHDGAECQGVWNQTQACQEGPCPVDGQWEGWSEWNSCSVACGGGQRNRTRSCKRALHGGIECEGEDLNTELCNTKYCSVDGVLTPWSGWSSCSLSCGGGSRWRNRTCDGPYYGGAPCEEPTEEEEVCNERNCPVDGVWMSWSSWAQCTTSCGDGILTRERRCQGPFYGGLECDGEASESKGCDNNPCPIDGQWTMWGSWTSCNATCGGGMQSRKRECLGTAYGGDACPGEDLSFQDCNTHVCSVDGVWLEWTQWSQCSQSCDEGVSVRQRTCQGPEYGGVDCTGPTKESANCFVKKCPVDGKWSSWADWSDCTLSCGNGTTSRNRTCIEPKYGGRPCEEGPWETTACNQHPCPVDGYWLPWENSGECSVSCGGGFQNRTRGCQSPKYGGKDCEGVSHMTLECNTHRCPVHCVWLEWGSWGECSATCAGGIHHRTRNKTDTKYGGKECSGHDVDEGECNTHNCPIDGFWSEWEEWSQCSVTCGGGTQVRSRDCVPPLYGGQDCQGRSNDTMACGQEHCPLPGLRQPWSKWTPCSVTCEGGTRSRSRACDRTTGLHTLPCEGESIETETCNDYDCLPIPLTCAHAVDRGLVNTDWITIDPMGGYPFTAICDVTSGDTIVHNRNGNETEVKGYEGPGEYRLAIVYVDKEDSEIWIENLIALSTASRTCKQMINWRCKSAVLNAPVDEGSRYRLTYWENLYGDAMAYWGGAHVRDSMRYPNTIMCACGENGTCGDPGNPTPTARCNCDLNDDVWRADGGYLTYKYDLPVTAFRAGDTGHNEMGYAFVGPLLCRGIFNPNDDEYNYGWLPPQ